VFGLVPALFCREKAAPAAPPVSQTGPKTSGFARFFMAAKRVMKSRSFLFLGVSVALISLGIGATLTINQYVMIFHIKGGDVKQGGKLFGFAMMLWQVSGLVFSWPIMWVSRRVDKKNALLIFLGLALVGNLLKWVCYNPAFPMLAIIPGICYAAGTTALWIIAPSMLADVCDWEEYNSGVRDGGMFAAMYSWMLKVGSSIAFVIGGLLLNFTGYDAAKGPIQTPDAIRGMRLTDMGLCVFSLAAAIILVARFPLTKGKMQVVRENLDRLKTSPAAGP
jgi:GPH family glycoside/pentoside/hexuronide:cation symporter